MFQFLEKLFDPFQAYIPKTPPKGVVAFIVESIRPLQHVLVISMVLTSISTAVELWLIWYGAYLVDVLAAADPATFWTQHGNELLFAAAFILLIRPLAPLLREAIDDIVFLPNAVTLVRWRAQRHVLQQSVGWFRNDLAGRIASRVMETGSTTAGAVYQIVHTVFSVGVYILGTAGLLASVDLRLIIPLVIWVGVYLGLMAYAVPRYRLAANKHQEAHSVLTGTIIDTYGNIDTVKLYADADADDRETRKRFGDALKSFVYAQKIEVTVNAAMVFLSSLLIVGLVGYSVVLWQAGNAPLGLVAATLALSFRIVSMAEWLLDAVAGLFVMAGSLQDSLATVAQPLDIVDAPNARLLDVRGGEIVFENVAHAYGKSAGGLRGINLTIAPGEKVGLVGRSGAGKSTLVNLLLRFYDAEDGRIAIDGQDIRSVTQNSLRQHIAMVTQDAALLHRSVRDNIAFGRADATPEMIAAAVNKAAADGFIPDLADQNGRMGYDAHVGERGVKLSGGQRQRIALARAIIKNAPILVLDEATSALDSEVEAVIQDTLYNVMEGKTVIAIAHRLSTIAHMDRIVVLDEGRIAEQGTHAALLAEKGIYASLWSRQSHGFIGST